MNAPEPAASTTAPLASLVTPVGALFRAPVPPTAEHALPTFRLTLLDETTSTNDDIKRALEAGEPEGFAVRARQQTGGYGRQGRTWASPEGGLYLSLLLRPPVKSAELPTLSLVVSLAARRAFASLEGLVNPEAILIKWPNDLVVSSIVRASEAGDEQGACALGTTPSLRSTYRKLCGISLETHAGGVCVGIGVNVYKAPFAESTNRANTLVYLSDLGYESSIDAVAPAVLGALEPLYAQWCAEGFASLLDEYERQSFLTGRFASMVNQSGNLIAEGTVMGIDAHGHLLLKSPDGTVAEVFSGEAHLR